MSYFDVFIGVAALIIGIIIAIVAVVMGKNGKSVGFTINSQGVKTNSTSGYEAFAAENGYTFDKGNGLTLTDRKVGENYHNSRLEELYDIDDEGEIQLGFYSKLVHKYAPFKTHPFGRGKQRLIRSIITGHYHDIEFQAFTYQYYLRIGEEGEYEVIEIFCDSPKGNLPAGVFYEQGRLVFFREGMLAVNELHLNLDKLIQYANGDNENDG